MKITMKKFVAVFTYLVLLCGHRFAQCESTNTQCQSIVGTPFQGCTQAGYNYTMPFPNSTSESVLRFAGRMLEDFLSETKNCSRQATAETIECGFWVPKCSRGKQDHPCRRVCAEYLKQCEKTLSKYGMDFMITSCFMLPDANVSSGECFEPPNFTANESEPSPLDRGCQRLIFPACKNLGLNNFTFISVEQQLILYKWFYNKNYTEDSAETEFPEYEIKFFKKYPACKEHIKKMFCGEMLPPCFPGEDGRPELFTVCQWVCDDIVQKCPEYLRENLHDEEYCNWLSDERSSSALCKLKNLPPAFGWLRLLERISARTEPPPTVPESTGTKTWVIVVAVFVPLVVVGLTLAVLILWKWKLVSNIGYKRHTDTGEDDAEQADT